jgi:hypothetical protein
MGHPDEAFAPIRVMQRVLELRRMPDQEDISRVRSDVSIIRVEAELTKCPRMEKDKTTKEEKGKQSSREKSSLTGTEPGQDYVIAII